VCDCESKSERESRETVVRNSVVPHSFNYICIMDLRHIKKTVNSGVPLNEAKRIIIMLHGRGATAEDILMLADHFAINDGHFIAPQATNNTWYPFGFMAPASQNEPWLSSALLLLKEITDELYNAGRSPSEIYIFGFSQGACLALEYTCRNAKKYGGIIAFTGGLIGDTINKENYKGNFDGAKVFIGNSDKDPHVPLIRSEESKQEFERRGAAVTLKVYPGMAHTIHPDEIKWVNENIFSSV
jgi:phospholipase/carboxylesterase